jgi:hypothetical protein
VDCDKLTESDEEAIVVVEASNLIVELVAGTTTAVLPLVVERKGVVSNRLLDVPSILFSRIFLNTII